MREGWDRLQFGDVLKLDVRKVAVLKERRYPIVGILAYGRGLLYREPVTTSSTSYRELNLIRPNQLVYSKLKAFEGAITVAPGDLTESYASGEFPTFTATARVLPAFLRLMTQRSELWEALAANSKGIGGRRERLNPSDFLTLAADFPPLSEQLRVTHLISALDDAIAATALGAHQLFELLERQRDELYWHSEKRIPLANLCSVDGNLVDPRGERANLPHLGAERIESGTGLLVGVVSAKEDGVVSGKYPFDERHVVYSKIRPNLRKVAMPDFSGLCSADAYPLLPADGVPRRFLQQLLLSSHFTDAATSRSGRTKMPKINRAELLSIEVPDHDRGFMDRSAHLLEALAQLLDTHRANMGRLQSLRSNILTALLSGEHAIPEGYDELMVEMS
jgi:type I restriction enzyme S subunit